MELKLCFPADNPPLAVIVAGKIGGLSLSADSSLPSGSTPALLLPNGMKLQGLYVLLRYVGRAGKIPKFYNRDAFESSQIDEWLEYASVFSSGSEFEGACGYVDGAFFKIIGTRLFWACLFGIVVAALLPRFVVKVFRQYVRPDDILIGREAEKFGDLMESRNGEIELTSD